MRVLSFCPPTTNLQLVKLGSQLVRPCASAKGPDAVTFTSARLTHVQSISGSEGGVEESVTSLSSAVNTCEVNAKPDMVCPDRDVLFRTPRIGVLPLRF